MYRLLIVSTFLLIEFCCAQQIGLKICECTARCFPNLPPDNVPPTSTTTPQIDVRIVNGGGTPAPIPTSIPPTNPCTAGLVQCCSECGVNYNITIGPVARQGQGRYGNQPWQALLIDRTMSYVGGGVLLNSNHILTAAHKVYPFRNTPVNLIVRLGDWDAVNSTVEPYKIQNSTVARIFIHESYVDAARNLTNDIAVLRLATPIRYGPAVNPAINTACLPTPTTNFENVRCVVSGWGKDGFNGAYQNIIKEVEVPVVSNAICQTRLRTTRALGPNFVLDPKSFMCAGGELNKDACIGDGGSPLMCRVADRYQIAGLVAWGIGCANGNVPGVYVRVQSYLDWIYIKMRTV